MSITHLDDFDEQWETAAEEEADSRRDQDVADQEQEIADRGDAYEGSLRQIKSRSRSRGSIADDLLAFMALLVLLAVVYSFLLAFADAGESVRSIELPSWSFGKRQSIESTLFPN